MSRPDPAARPRPRVRHPRLRGRRRRRPSLAGARLPAASLAAALVLLGASPAAAQPRFTVPPPAADHPHAELASELAAILAAGWERSVFPPGPVALTSDDCPEARIRTEIEDGGGDGPRARVVLCAGLAEAVRGELEATELSPAERDSVLRAALLFAYAYETAHAFSRLPAPGPATGTEESAVEFAALTLLSRPRWAHGAALYWGRPSGELPQEARRLAGDLPAALPAWGADHGLDAVSMSDLACLVYGERPGERAWMVDGALLTRATAGRCPDAFRDARDRWGAVLEGRIQLPERPPPPPTSPGAEERAGDGAEQQEAGEPAPWGEAEGLWSSYRVRVGDVVAPLLADILRARERLPGRAVVTWEPDPGTLDVEIYGDALSQERARDVVEEYRDYVEDAFLPYLERRFGPDVSMREFRFVYYDATGDDPEPVVALMRGEWATP